MTRSLTIIGAGKVGKALGRLWALNDTFIIHDVLARSANSAQMAVDFIGAGVAVDSYATLRPADVYMIATPDDQIAASCAALVATGILVEGNIVFHCSGALASGVLNAASPCGASIASTHPIRSFAIPAQVVKHFAGTYCGAEGDPLALDILRDAFAAIGAEWVVIDRDLKILYHAAAVMASNYLVTLLDLAQQTYIKAGIAPDQALQLMGPLVRETVDNVFRYGPAKALTGPIARGDMQTVERQSKALQASNPQHAQLYDQMVGLTIELAKRKHDAAK